VWTRITNQPSANQLQVEVAIVLMVRSNVVPNLSGTILVSRLRSNSCIVCTFTSSLTFYNLADFQDTAQIYAVIPPPKRLVMTMKLWRSHAQILHRVAGK
jgi:hypothetical protein